MAVNFRSRLEGLCDKDAGNYEGLLCLPGPGLSAAEVRRALTELRAPRRRAVEPPLPSFWETLSSRLAVITSWAFHEPRVQGAELLLHLPHFDLDQVNSDMAVVFRPRKGQLAVLTFLKDLEAEQLASSELFGASVSESIFRDERVGGVQAWSRFKVVFPSFSGPEVDTWSVLQLD